METETKENPNKGRRVRLILRQMNGVNSIFNGVFLGEDATSFRIKTDRGEELVQPKLFSTLEWLSEARA